jgi:hypothetical protein
MTGPGGLKNNYSVRTGPRGELGEKRKTVMTTMQLSTKHNRLTAYGLACGYVERQEAIGRQVTLWREHGVYHVRAHDFREHKRLAWETYIHLHIAQRAYRALVANYLN